LKSAARAGSGAALGELRFHCDCKAAHVRVLAAPGEPWPNQAACPGCARVHTLHGERRTNGGGLLGCLRCGHPELYTQQDFPRPLGLGIVVVAAVLAPFTAYASLGVAALLDCALYFLGPSVVVCYVCSAQHRRFPPVPRHPRFDREIEERLKFGERAVMGKPMSPGGTAGAPEPEH
jgi:hypothetical protein